VDANRFHENLLINPLFLTVEKMERPFLFYHWEGKTPKDSQSRWNSGPDIGLQTLGETGRKPEVKVMNKAIIENT
jgi:hypothetical protein